MAKSKGANQYGHYVWVPTDQQRDNAKYSARINRKGITVRANSDSIEELTKDLTEMLEKLTPLVGNGVEGDEEKD